MSDRVLNYQSDVAVSQFGYLGIGVSDIDAWKEFAGSVLGMQDNGVSAAGDTYLRMDENHHRFILTNNGKDDIAFHGWEVKDNAALEQMAAKIRAFGLDVTEGTPEEAAERMVRRLIKFNDPDGLPTEVYYGPLLDHKPFISPRGVSGFKAGNLGWGHMVLAVDDPETYIRFLTEVFGAKISDYINFTIGPMTLSLAFMHVNPRHHSIAIAGKMKLPPGAPPQPRLNHIMVELNAMDDVGIGLSLFQQKGIPTGALGRHTNDHMLSFYGQTPSGFNVEYGYGGRLIEDEDKWEVQVYRAASIWGHGMPPRAAPGAPPPQAPAPAAA